MKNTLFINPPVFLSIMAGKPNRVKVAVRSTTRPCPYGSPGDQIWIHNDRMAGLARLAAVKIEPTHDRKYWMWALDIEKL